MSGRTHKSIGAIVRFLCRYIGDHRFARILIDVANALLSSYEDTFDQFSGEIGRNFLYLRKIIRKEEELSIDFLGLQGAFELIIAGASCGEQSETTPTLETKVTNDLVASASAREEPVISV